MSKSLATKPPLTTNVVILNGMARSGKKLSCRILSNLERVEFFQYTSVVENLCYLYGLGMIGAENAAALLRAHVDEAVYNYAIGRCLNTRVADESCIYNAPELELYIRRSAAPSGAAAVASLNEAGRIALIDTHSTLAWAGLLFDAMPYLRLVHVTRHPVDIAEDWLRRGWGGRYGVDPIAFNLVVAASDGTLVPWFAADWADEYAAMTECERCVESVVRLQAEEQAAYAALPPERKERVFRYAFEHMLAEPHHVIDELCRFLGVEPRDTLPGLLATEGCPAGIPASARQANYRVLARESSPAVLERLSRAATAYERVWQIPVPTK